MRTASGAEHRLQPQSFRNRGLPGRRTVRLTPLNASSHRFFLFWAERTVDSVRPVASSVDRSWRQRPAVRIILGPRNAEAVPPPVLGTPYQVGPQGVPLDIAAHREEMLVRLHGGRLEPALIEMTGAGRSVVRTSPLGERHGEPAHEPGEVAILTWPEQDVEVVGHQAVSQQSHVMAHHRLREDALECRIILVGLKDSQPGVGPIQGVVDEATFRRSSWSWHVLRIQDDERGVRNGSCPLSPHGMTSGVSETAPARFPLPKLFGVSGWKRSRPTRIGCTACVRWPKHGCLTVPFAIEFSCRDRR